MICFIILAVLIMSWCRQRRLHMILAIPRSAISVNEFSIGWHE